MNDKQKAALYAKAIAKKRCNIEGQLNDLLDDHTDIDLLPQEDRRAIWGALSEALQVARGE